MTFEQEQGPIYAAELEKLSEFISPLHPAGEQKHIGRREVAQAAIEVIEDMKSQLKQWQDEWEKEPYG